MKHRQITTQKDWRDCNAELLRMLIIKTLAILAGSILLVISILSIAWYKLS